ncbi:MAG: hypothetical protein QUS35_11310 [bacterium]|nr:hypothetical protein [bacterium]
MKTGEFDILWGNSRFTIRGPSMERPGDRDRLAELSLALAEALNPGFDRNAETAAEWSRYIRLIADGRGGPLENPYADLPEYRIAPVTPETGLDPGTPLVARLDSAAADRTDPAAGSAGDLSRALLVLAVGGADTTFYDGMDEAATESFLRAFLSEECAGCFDAASLRRGVPRAFISRPDGAGGRITHLESLLVQAHESGIRHAVILTNASLADAVGRFLDRRLGRLSGLNRIVAVQPLLASPVLEPGSGRWVVSPDGAGFPGGHGHGFKHALRHPAVVAWIRDRGLKTFLFSNGDNAALFRGGPGPFTAGLRGLEALRSRPGHENCGLALFLVWEPAQKGGFAFFLDPLNGGERRVRIVEMELAAAAGMGPDALRGGRFAYNTNVAVGFLDPVIRRLDRLPMALKRKRIDGRDRLLLEASFATALTSSQDENGFTRSDPRSALFLLPPDPSAHPHWMHMSIRKRADWLAYASTVFRTRRTGAAPGGFVVVESGRPAVRPLPRLEGDITRTDLLTSAAFFEVFRDAAIDMAEFDGTLRVDFPEGPALGRGSLKFEGNVRFEGSGVIAFTVPPGERWVVRDRTFKSPAFIRSI